MARNGSTRRWRELRQQVLQRDGFQCQLQLPGCTGNATHADHVVPVAHGGDDTLGNLLAACADCNLAKGSKLPGASSLAGHRTPLPPMSAPSARRTVRVTHAEVPQ